MSVLSRDIFLAMIVKAVFSFPKKVKVDSLMKFMNCIHEFAPILDSL